MRRTIIPALTVMIISFSMNTTSTLANTIDALYFIFMDFNNVESITSFYEEVDLTEEQRMGITSLAYENHEQNSQYYNEYEQSLKTEEDTEKYNENLQKSQEKLIFDLQNLLGDEYDDFEKWFNNLWKSNKYKVPVNSLSD